MGFRKVSVVASIGYEAVLQLGAASAVGAICLVLVLGPVAPIGMFYLVSLAGLACVPLVFRRGVLQPVVNRALVLAKRPPLASDALLDDRTIGVAFMCYAAVHLLNGAAFYIIVSSVLQAAADPLLVIAAFTLGGAAGVAAVFVPSGIGVREAVIVALLAPAVQPEVALLAAALARGTSIIADMSPLAVLMAMDLLRRRVVRRQTA
jgi:uncharacterized membrane protein YbhN (UPF0104 family)